MQETFDGVEMAALSDADLMPGNVTVAVSHSTVNYKDGLALTGQAPILRRSPMTPGIDFTGEVIHSESADFRPGDQHAAQPLVAARVMAPSLT